MRQQGRDKNRWRRCLAVLLSLFVSMALAQEPNHGAQVRAAFIYNFAKFVEWPAHTFASGAAPLHLCALSGSNKAARLDLIDGRSAQGHPIVLQWISNAQQAGGCQILYLTRADIASHRQLMPAIQHWPILTIGENEAFINQGGMVALFVDRDHVRFSINQSAAQVSGLKISARLLQLARTVR